jgi:hypothetical protein
MIVADIALAVLSGLMLISFAFGEAALVISEL